MGCSRCQGTPSWPPHVGNSLMASAAGSWVGLVWLWKMKNTFYFPSGALEWGSPGSDPTFTFDQLWVHKLLHLSKQLVGKREAPLCLRKAVLTRCHVLYSWVWERLSTLPTTAQSDGPCDAQNKILTDTSPSHLGCWWTLSGQSSFLHHTWNWAEPLAGDEVRASHQCSFFLSFHGACHWFVF